jgi:hypothetical protein
VRFFLAVFGSLLLASCKTYQIPKELFAEQFHSFDSSDLKQVTITGAVNASYLANPIERIQCRDKNGNAVELNTSPSIEIRFTHGTKNKKTIFYFDRVFLADTLVFGAPSRITASLIKSVPINEVTKIEVQDGRKNFNYKK